jgi:TolB-like protein/DNA-binding winged helix-turn-helix (wHTH) protein
MTAPPLRFRDFELDAGQFELRRAGHRVRLERKPLELLILLVEKQGELVVREEIIQRVWGKDLFFDAERGINNAICKIRSALNDESEQPRFVETVIGKGYRFIAPMNGATPVAQSTSVESAEGPVAGLRWHRALPSKLGLAGACLLVVVAVLATLVTPNLESVRRRLFASSSPARIQSLAVLPLENLSGDPTQDYFADGVTDELTTELAQVPGLRVISRISAMQYRAKRKSAPQIGNELHVGALVEGSVVRSGDHVRITAQLIETKDDRHLWAQSFEGEVKDLVEIQDEVAGKIAGQIRLRIPPREEPRSTQARTLNPEAHDLYMRGIALRDNNDDISLRKSIYWFRLSLEKDPDYAPAHAGLAVAYTFQSFLGVLPTQETSPKAEEEARRALALDTSLGKAHDALAWIAYVYRWDWPLTEKELRRALELNPNDVDAHHYYSHYLFSMGRVREALAEGEVAAGLDPLSQIQKNHLLWQYVEAKNFDRAIEIGKKIVEASATDPTQYVLLADAYAGKGRFEDSVVLLQEGIALSPTRAEPQEALANTYARMGKTKEARKILRQLENPPRGQHVGPMGIAVIYCTLGEKDRALEWLEKAIEQRDAGMGDLSSLPGLETLHADPRFQDVVRRVGLPMHFIPSS